MSKSKFVSVFVLLALLLSAGPGAVVADEPPPEADPRSQGPQEQYQELFERYGIVEAKEIPPEITPLRVNSPEELENLIATFLNGKRVDVSDRFCVDSLVDEGVLPAGVALDGVQYITVRRECTQNMGTATFYTTADIRIGVYNSSYRWIDSVNEWVGLRGVTMGLDLVQEYHYHYITATTADITGGGVVDHYLLVNGMIKVWSTPVECSIHYSLSVR